MTFEFIFMVESSAFKYLQTWPSTFKERAYYIADLYLAYSKHFVKSTKHKYEEVQPLPWNTRVAFIILWSELNYNFIENLKDIRFNLNKRYQRIYDEILNSYSNNIKQKKILYYMLQKNITKYKYYIRGFTYKYRKST